MKTTKRALFSSVVALLLCFSMLLGTTFAWFTDSVTSANNVIKSGNLDVELYYQVEGQNGWTKVTSTSNIFMENALWEPGHAEIVKLKVVNEGNLALKYQLSVNIASETGSINVDGAAFMLSEYIKFGIVDGAQSYTREQAISAVDATATALKDAYKSEFVSLLPLNAENDDNEDIVTMVVYMPTTVGNEANYAKDAAQPTIHLGINLLATQLDFENDAFGNDYDAGLGMQEENGTSRTLADGSTIFYYNEASGNAGRVRLIELPENFGSEYVVPTVVNDLGGALVGVELDKLTIHAGVVSAYKSLEGATIDEVVIEDGATIIPNRMFYKANINSVVIPSSVTTIEQNAFAMAGLESIVIPASVSTVGEAAFQHMPNLETVTFEGNTAIAGYAFRGCAALRTVHLKGDDVTFVVSETGKNSCWFCNGESNNPGTSDITFYVENETVAARVKTAMGAEANNTKIYVDGKITVKVNSGEEFLSALATATAGTTIDATGVTLVPADDITTTIVIPAGVTVKGANFAPNGACWLLIGDGDQTVAFENCTFTGLPLDQFKIATKGCDDITYTDCNFIGMIMINNCDNRDAVNTFNNCSFDLAAGFIKCGYVNCMAGSSIFNQCTFNYAGGSTMGSNQYMQWNAVNSYSENTNTLESNNYTTYVELNGCVRNGCGTYKNTANSTLVVQ